MKWKKDNKLPNTKNVKKKNPQNQQNQQQNQQQTASNQQNQQTTASQQSQQSSGNNHDLSQLGLANQAPTMLNTNDLKTEGPPYGLTEL